MGMSIEILLLIIAFLLAISGLLGSFLPVIPGPPLAFLGLLCMYFTPHFSPERNVLWLHLILSTAITLFDYVIPVLGSRWFGGSKAGSRGAMLGLIVGLFAGPMGIILGPFLGSFLGELYTNAPVKKAFRAAMGSFLGFLTGVFLKASYAIYVIILMIKLLVNN
jgi:uncharacterized protein YqgC (DUF456 family)